MRRLAIVTALLTALAWCALPAHQVSAANVYYVNGDPSIGSNGYDCLSPTYTSGIHGPCRTIHGALFKAPSGDTLYVAGPDAGFNGVYCEQLTIDMPLTLQALSLTNRPAIDGGAPLPGGATNPCGTLGGDAPGRSVVTVGDASTTTMGVTLQGLIIQNGDGTNNPTDAYNKSGEGGGIFAYPVVTLTVNNSTVSGNIACNGSRCDTSVGGYGYGGGVFNDGTTTLSNSTISGNFGCPSLDSGCGSAHGGGIDNQGTMTLANSTVSGNASSGSGADEGGGIFNQGTLTMTNSTVSDNTSRGNGAGIYTDSTTRLINSTVSGNTAQEHGGGIFNQGTTTLTNTIVAGNADYNSTSPDCMGSLSDGSPNGSPVGDNILGNSAGCTVTNFNHNDQLDVDPKLAPLGNNGGPTQTMALLLTSPALGLADRSTCQLTTIYGGGPGPNGEDQRGEPRPTTTCDIGAYQSVPTTYASTSGSDSNSCAIASAPCRHIATALAIVQPSGTVNIASGTYCEQLTVDESVSVLATGSTPAVVDGGGPLATDAPGTNSNPCRTEDPPGYPVLRIGDSGQNAISVALRGLTIQHGDAFDGGSGGGLFIYTGATVAVTNTSISGNTACSASGCSPYGFGGGIYDYGTLTLTDSTVSGNTACTSSCHGWGGGIINGESLTVVNSTISGNAACTGTCSSAYGGGMFGLGALTIVNSTVSGNTVCTGGGCSGSGGGINGSGVNVTNTIVAGNTGATDGSNDCSGSLSDGSPNGSTVGHNILGNTDGCTTTNLTDHDQLNVDPKLDTHGLQSNGGPTRTIALQSTSSAIGKGDAATCHAPSLAGLGSASGPNNLDQRGYPRNADTRGVCDIGAYDTGGPWTIAITSGWNLIDVPLQSSSTGTASGLVSTMNSQLGSGSISGLATYSHGCFHVYVSGYSANQDLQPSQGIFVLSHTAGTWDPAGSAYTSGQVVNLQRGWNVGAEPYPSAGLDGSAINSEAGTGCGLQEVATYGGGSYTIHSPSSSYHVPATAGMWMQCTKSFAWTPS